MRVLVTGCGGYVGNVLCRDLLAKGYYVRGVDNFYKGHCDQIIELVPKKNFEFMYGDVTNDDHLEQMVKGMDAVIHLAAIVGFPECKKSPILAKAVNVDGTKGLLHHMEDKPFVFASTGSVYGAVEETCTEDTPLNAVSLYGETKREAELAVTARGNSVAFRFATGFGVSPNMRVNLLVNDLVYQAVTQRALNVFEATARRTFIHVRDMSRAFIFGLENLDRLKHQVYNCGANHLNWTKRELVEHIKKLTGAAVSYNETHTDLDKRDYEVDYSRLNAEGFYCNVSMQEGIDELIKVAPILQINHQYK